MNQEYWNGDPKTLTATHTAYLARWLRVLFFWGLFVCFAVGTLKSDPIQIWIDRGFWNPQLVIMCLDFIGPAGMVFLFVKLGRMSSYYRCVMFVQIAFVAVNLALVDKGSNSPTWWAMSLLWWILAIVKTYQCYYGHAELLDAIRSPLAEKWRRLWKWSIGMNFGLLVGLLTMLVFSTLGMILLTVSLLGLIVLGVLELVYLWQTADRFRNYNSEERWEALNETAL